MVDNEHQILTDLGLTLLQAKAYLALSQLGKATIKTISKTANIARQDVYRVMPELEKLGLAEKIVAKPTRYKATPIKEGIHFLLQRKTQQYNELTKKAVELINNLNEGNCKTPVQEEETQFIITSSEKLLWKRLQEGAETAQTSIDICTDLEGFKHRVFHDLPNFKRAVKRGVRIRVITEKNDADNGLQKIIKPLKNDPLFEIRYFPPPVPIKTAIYDKKEVNLCLTTPNKIGGLPSLWSNNPQFAKIIADYFEELWSKAQSEVNSSAEKS
jgi:sugar-specific transcriptional regulator TrmB